VRHRPYGPDIAPSDFFLFGCLKKTPQDILHYERQSHLCDIATFSTIPEIVLNNVLINWVPKLSWIMKRMANTAPNNEERIELSLSSNQSERRIGTFLSAYPQVLYAMPSLICWKIATPSCNARRIGLSSAEFLTSFTTENKPECHVNSMNYLSSQSREIPRNLSKHGS
jgi:hypothetical protein